MVWHDCKTDPPKKSGFYLLVYQYDVVFNDISYDCSIIYDRGLFQNGKWSLWHGDFWTYVENIEYENIIPYKWSEVDLSEVE